jgi:lysophospholipase L1-like esterase
MAKTAKTRKTLLAFAIVVLIMSAYSAAMIVVSGSSRLIRVACVGDSITEGSEYPKTLQNMLGADYRVGNFGISGSTVMLSSDLPYMNQSAFRLAKRFQPSIVIIMLGTNDAAKSPAELTANFQSDYKSIISEYQTLKSSPEIWLVNPPPLFENNLNLNNTSLNQDIIPGIQQVAGELGLPVIDVNSALTQYPEYFGDGVHPNSEGAFLIATTINQAFTANNAVINTAP